MNQDTQQKLSSEEIKTLDIAGYVPRGMGFASKKTGRFVSNKEVDSAIGSVRDKQTAERAAGETISSIQSSLSSISSSLGTIEGILSKMLEQQKMAEYAKEEASLEAVPVIRPRPTSTTRETDSESTSSILKSLLLNPAVIAAFSGLAYMLLPKDVKERIQGFFSGFAEQTAETFKEMDAFKAAVLTAASGFALFLGAKTFEKISDAISSTISLITKAKSIFGKSKRVASKIAAAAKANKGALAGGLAAAGVAGAAVASKEEKEDSVEKNKEQEYSQPVSKPSPSITATPSTSSTGFKAKGAEGFKAPQVSGDDASIMAMIKEHEGVRTRPYKDSLGLWTVGVGHLIGNGKTLPPEYNREFSMQEIDALFAKDYIHHKQAAEKIPGYSKLNEKGKAALIDLTYNMGPAWYRKWPNFTKSISQGDTEGAAESLENSLWYRQVGRRAPRVVALMRQGADENGSAQATMASADKSTSLSETASLEPSSASTGSTMIASSEASESMTYSTPSVMTNVVDNSREISEKEGPDAPPPIPSPIADRGSLAVNIKHLTSYA